LPVLDDHPTGFISPDQQFLSDIPFVPVEWTSLTDQNRRLGGYRFHPFSPVLGFSSYFGKFPVYGIIYQINTILCGDGSVTARADAEKQSPTDFYSTR
jgi:hypothetical protein